MSMRQDLEKLRTQLAAINRPDLAHRVEGVVHLNASGTGPEELGEGDLEDVAGGDCGSFSCTVYRIWNSADGSSSA